MNKPQFRPGECYACPSGFSFEVLRVYQDEIDVMWTFRTLSPAKSRENLRAFIAYFKAERYVLYEAEFL